ncbi:alpha/beta hydrolase [Aestuariivirga sp.]|uniref:alpha/beta fold hydrolase n=1 Tax=Aestuariivirga sp. TaxID=2650926 RepID=UPI0025BBAFED|nr:alpha/beta hydrolase [Aestuariivirga sp.]MCA3555707.1 alpha/beta hydrolase [Aestuariivirga sp.]
MTNLVMIPAFGCDERLYAGIAPLLPSNVLSSTVIADGVDFAACVEQVLARAPERFVLLGTSFGGRVALEATLAAPDRVQGLIVTGASAGPVADRRAGFRRSERLRAGEAQQVTEEMADMIAHMEGPNGSATRQAFIDMCATLGPDAMTRQSDALAHRADLYPRLDEIACPALMLWGVHDKFSAAAEGLRMSAAIPKGRYVELADCGHFPTLEYPDETAAAIGHWMEDMGLSPRL